MPEKLRLTRIEKISEDLTDIDFLYGDRDFFSFRFSRCGWKSLTTEERYIPFDVILSALDIAKYMLKDFTKYNGDEVYEIY